MWVHYLCLDLHVYGNRGVLLNFDKHISSVISSSFYQVRLLSKIKPFLNHKTLEMAVHAFITSSLDYCNSLYCSISKSQIACVQLVQNAAARFLNNSCKSTHITHILRSLRSSDQNLLLVPHSRHSRGDRAFSVVGPRLWNNLPLEIRFAPFLTTFKSLLETHLFSMAYN